MKGAGSANREGSRREAPRIPNAPRPALGESAASRSPTSWAGRPLLSPSLPLRPGPRSRREEEESLELVPAAHLLPPAGELRPSAPRARLW